MEDVQSHNERRAHDRYQALKGAFVATLMPERKLWQILDISQGGLAFRYIPSEHKISESSKLEIITRDVRFTLENIPYKTVSEAEYSEKSSLGYPLLRHSVQFGSLTEKQMSKLSQFIKKHTKA